MRIGVLGGTFDPVHLGHLIIAEEARTRLSLEKVLFVPAGRPWFKDGNDVTDTADRLEMLRLALEGNPQFSIDTQELERPGATYTVDTIAQLREQMGPEAEIFFIIGLDALAELNRWKDPERLARMCFFAAMRRPEFTELDVASLVKTVPGVSGRVHLLENIQVDISSSDIRCRIQEGLPIRYLVPRKVDEYIRGKGLYLKQSR
ncbi:MAG: nicotinate-nucleotide adenylyltransferase [Chloroflexi bacterium]|nr:nicotinate-nucleotide adenylyltransferase [Chloroflexota bacterium]